MKADRKSLGLGLLAVFVGLAISVIWSQPPLEEGRPSVLASLRTLFKRPSQAPLGAIFNNLSIIEGAKDEWAQEKGKKDGDLPTESDMAPYLKGNRLPRPSELGESYTINPVGVAATAKLPMNVKFGTYSKGATITLP